MRVGLAAEASIVPAPDRLRTWVRAAGWVVTLTLGGVHVFGSAIRHAMNPDGVAYLDIGDAYVRGDWHTAINTYWSPLYSWLLGIGMRLANPSERFEFPTVHLINFVIYLAAFICFERFWLELGRGRRERLDKNGESFPIPLWLALGYSLFLYSALTLIRVWSVTPDMLVAAIVFAAAALVTRARSRRATARTFALLGVVLGLGYLAKSAMLPVAFVCLAALGVSLPPTKQTMRRLLITMVCLLAVAGPLVAVLSATKGHLTFGDTGKLMYAWHINGVPHPHWRGEVPGAGTPTHGSQRIFESPAIYAFARPSHGTYPIAYDPAYWYDGVTPHFEWTGQAKVLAISVQQYFELFVRQQGGLIVAIFALYWWRDKRGRGSIWSCARESPLAAVAVVALGMYAVVHVQGRYVGPFFVLLWGDLLAGVRLPDSEQARRSVMFASGVMVAILWINILAFTLERGGRVVTSTTVVTAAPQAPEGPRWPGEVADELRRLGIHRGDSVATIGYAFDAYWARLARVQIVAEMFGGEAEPFWTGPPSFQRRVLDAFASTGAKAVIAEHVPDRMLPAGWHQVGRSDCYIYVLDGISRADGVKGLSRMVHGGRGTTPRSDIARGRGSEPSDNPAAGRETRT